jgi:exopolysaccharide biosynthesis WecB/TagA/CpsF family protein
MPISRREFLEVRFNSLSIDQVLAHVAGATDDSPYGYVVTPNVDHIVRLHEEQDPSFLRKIYEDADLCLCDSKVLHLLGRMRGVELPVVAGSDLTAIVFDRIVRPGDRIAVIGGDAELLSALRSRYPLVDFVQHCPPMGLRDDPKARRVAAAFIANCSARFSFIAVGSPQQEMIAAETKMIAGATGMSFCIGAGLDFLTGRQRRAPRFAQRLGLEWAHRLLSDPRRMWKRYLLTGPKVFLLAHRWECTR